MMNISVSGFWIGQGVRSLTKSKQRTYHLFSGELCVVSVIMGTQKSSRLALHVGTVCLKAQGYN